jgi:acyl-CoA synthetase (AMP-forming)/AMP-acid ligase II
LGTRLDLLLDLRDYLTSPFGGRPRREQVASELARLPRLLTSTVPRFLRARSAEHATLASFVARHARERPDALALISAEEQLTYRELDARLSAVARALLGLGVTNGGRISLVGHPGPSYLAIVLGAARAGVATALVSPALAGELFERALGATETDLVLIEAGLAAESGRARRVEFGPGSEFDARVERELGLTFLPPRVSAGADYVFVFTSGTTGLPKACRVTHDRALIAGVTFSELVLGLREGDRVYAPLPLHHSSALILAAGSCLVSGVPLVLRRRFSASEFLDDVRRFEATVMLYIGELCRALVAQPESPRDRDHSLRLALGNGLAPDVWERFVERFGVREIREFYGASDAPSAIVNLTSHPGSVGHVPLRRARGFRLVRIDERGEPARDERGRGVECDPGESGELVIKIRPRAGAELGDVPVYTDARASHARVVQDLFEPGDRYYRTFDRLSMDRHGYLRFVERASESFRYKGENVSCAEVEGVLRQAPGVLDLAVVGIGVPGVDGTPPLAAVVSSAAFSLSAFEETAHGLPQYARPRFLRLVRHLPLGETLKIVRRELASKGIEPGAEADDLYVLGEHGYRPLTPELARGIAAGELRL